MEKLCAICQTSAEHLLCDDCQNQWGTGYAWVQKLMALEQHRRRVEAMEDALTDAYITADGCLWSTTAQSLGSARSKLQSLYDDDESALLIQEIQAWGKTGGLTPAEQRAYEMMQAGFTLNDAMSAIQEVEQKAVTISAYRHRMTSLIKKIRRATQAGEVGV